MKIYHYASVDSWRDIKKGSWQSGGEPGLGANRRVCINNSEDEGARDGAVFGLLEPEPDSWVNNTEFPVAWKYLMKDVGRLLLTYELTDEIVGQSFIIDWSHKERVSGGHRKDLGKNRKAEVSHKKILAAEKSYWNSKVPLADYINDPGAIAGIVLPEVITMCDVPFSLIEIADTQPRLRNLPPFEKEELNFAVEHNPGLAVLATHIS